MHTNNFNFLTFWRNLKLNRTNWEQSSDVNQRSVRRTLLSSDFIIESESLQSNGRWCEVDLSFVPQYPSLRGCAGNVMMTCDDERKKYHQRWGKHRLINCLYFWHCFHCLHCWHCLQNQNRRQWDGHNYCPQSAWIIRYQSKYTVRVAGVVIQG